MQLNGHRKTSKEKKLDIISVMNVSVGTQQVKNKYIMIDSNKKIRIFDDTGSGDDFDVISVLYENDKVLVCNATNEWYDGYMTIMIYKEDGVVMCKEFMFYLAENY